MPSRSDLRQYYAIEAQLAPAIHQQQNWPYEVPHPRYVAYMVPPHDVGGQADVPVYYEEKEEELWELNTYVTCEVLGWRGVWNAEERRRRGNNDLGLSLYYGLPYYGRWIWAAARMLVDKNHVDVVYSIVLDGAVVLDHLPGAAVRAGDHWLVTRQTYCQVATLGATTVPEPCR